MQHFNFTSTRQNSSSEAFPNYLATMTNRPLFQFFNKAGYFYIKDRDGKPDFRNVLQVCRDDGQDGIGDFDVSVSDPRGLLKWLQQPENSLDHLVTLSLFIEATTLDSMLPPTISMWGDQTADDWLRLFEYISPMLTNLKNLSVYWDCEGCHRGLGKSLAFIRALAKLRPSEGVTLAGFYAVNWPNYLENEMQVAVVKDMIPHHGLRSFQVGTEVLWP